MLKEQGFQQSGCVSSECAVEAGKLLGVDQIVTGSIGKIGSYYTVSANDYGKPVSAGIYLYQIQAGEYMRTK